MLAAAPRLTLSSLTVTVMMVVDCQFVVVSHADSTLVAQSVVIFSTSHSSTKTSLSNFTHRLSLRCSESLWVCVGDPVVLRRSRVNIHELRVNFLLLWVCTVPALFTGLPFRQSAQTCHFVTGRKLERALVI